MIRVRAGAALAALSLLGASALWSGVADAQCVSLTTLGAASTQNFDTLSNTAGSTTNNLTITGWFMTETGGGARDNEQYGVDTGASTTGDTYSYGAAASTERALGQLRSGTLIPNFGACFTNNTGNTINSLDVAYSGEQWRLGTVTRTDQMNFEYSLNATDLVTGTWIGVAGLNFVTPFTTTTGALNGNAAANRTALSSSIPALTIANGATFWVRWSDTDASGADDGLAVDDFSLTPNGAAGTPFTLTTNSPQTINVLVGASADVTVTATVANPTAGTSYTVQVLGDAAFPPLSPSLVTTYLGFPPGDLPFTRTCTPLARGVFQAVVSVRATQTAGPIVGTNPQTVNNVTWICQTPSDLTLTVSDGGASGTVGGTVAYTFQYANASAQATAGVTLSTTVPVNTTFNAGGSTAGWSCANGSAAGTVCNLAIGALGASPAAGSATFALNMLAGAGGTTVTLNGTIADDGVGGTDTAPGNNASSDTTAVAGASADLTVVLADSPDPVTAGTNLSYAVTVTNNGPSDAADASFSLPLPATTTFVSATAAGATCTTPAVGANGTVSCTWTGNTAAGSGNARTATVVALVPANTANGATLNAAVTVTSATTDPVGANNSATTGTAVVARSNLSITLTDTPDPVNAGGNVTYVATLSNGGPSDAQGANISLPLDAATTFVSAVASAGASCTTPAVGANGTVTCTWSGATVPGATRDVTVVAGVPANIANGTVLLTSAVAAATTTDPTPGNNQASSTTTVVATADLSITLTGAPDPVTAGTNLTYTATLTNGGPSDAQDATISLPLPAGTSFVSATAVGGSCNTASPVVCTWAGATAAAGVRTATIVALVAPAQTAALSATATASTTSTDPNAANNTATATTTVVTSADLSITLTDAPDPVSAGSNLTYTATVANAGPSDATGVTITLPLPTNTSLVSGSVSGGGSCAGAPVVCSVTGSVAPGSSRVATIVVAVDAGAANGAVLSATATVATASTDPNGANNSASTTTTVVNSADLLIGLSASPTPVAVNVPVTFTVTSLNQGPSAAQDLVITLTLTPDFRYSSHTATGATCTTPQVGTTGAIVCTWAGATAPGVTRTLTVVAYSNNEGSTAVNASTSSTTTDPVPNNNLSNLSVVVGYLTQEIPSLNGLGLVLLGLLLGFAGLVAARRQA